MAVRTSAPTGETVILVVLGPGQVVGELALLQGEARRSATVVALEATDVWSSRRDTLHMLRRERPGVDAFVLATLVADIHRLSGLLLEALFLPVETRVLHRLLVLTEEYHRPGDSPPTIPLTQDDIAGLAGASRATVNAVLRNAEQNGILRLGRGRIEVLDPGALARKAR